MKTKISPEQARHTPGPWRVDGAAIEAKFGGKIVQVAMMGRTRWCGDISEKTRRMATEFRKLEAADAHLIAAAPALLEALRNLRESVTDAYKAGRIPAEPFVAAGNIIAKATETTNDPT